MVATFVCAIIKISRQSWILINMLSVLACCVVVMVDFWTIHYYHANTGTNLSTFISGLQNVYDTFVGCQVLLIIWIPESLLRKDISVVVCKMVALILHYY